MVKLKFGEVSKSEKDEIEIESVSLLKVKGPPKTNRPAKPAPRPDQPNRLTISENENLSLLRANSSGSSRSAACIEAEKPHSKTCLIKGDVPFLPTKQSHYFDIRRSSTSNRFFINHYQMEYQIGRGAFGVVNLVIDTEKNIRYAMKSLSRAKLIKSSGMFNKPPPPRASMTSRSNSFRRISYFNPIMGLDMFKNNEKRKADTHDPLNRVLSEINIHSRLNHPNVIRLVEVLTDKTKDEMHFVFELAELGPVYKIDLDPPLNEEQARCYFRDTVLGLEYLHNRGVIHRDIKPDNLLLCKNGHVKISDFGVSCEFLTEEDVYFSDTVGSPAFLAPEVVKESDTKFNGRGIDIWALGVSLYSFLFGLLPFRSRSRNDLYHDIVFEPHDMPVKPHVSETAQDLVNKLLTKEPLERIKMCEIKTHPWTTFNDSFVLPSTEDNCVRGSSPELKVYPRRYSLFQEAENAKRSSLHMHDLKREDTDDWMRVRLFRISCNSRNSTRLSHHQNLFSYMSKSFENGY